MTNRTGDNKATPWLLIVGFSFIAGSVLTLVAIEASGGRLRTDDLNNLIEVLSSYRADARVLQRDASDALSRIESLTTEELSAGVRGLEDRTNRLTREVEALEQVISPKNAGDILTIARLRDEISAREAFEARSKREYTEFRSDVRGELSAVKEQVGGVDQSLRSLYFWIFSLFTSVIAAGGIALAYLVRRLDRLQSGDPGGRMEDRAATEDT